MHLHVIPEAKTDLTIYLDLDETLMTLNKSGAAPVIRPRPHVKQFLQHASSFGQLFILSRGTEPYIRLVTAKMGIAGYFRGFYSARDQLTLTADNWCLVDDLTPVHQLKLTALGCEANDPRIIHIAPYRGGKEDGQEFRKVLQQLRTQASHVQVPA